MNESLVYAMWAFGMLCYVRIFSLRYVRISRLCYVRLLSAGSPLRGSPLASLAWLASQAKLAPAAALTKEDLNYPVNSNELSALGSLPAHSA